jgi:hypothetical protein
MPRPAQFDTAELDDLIAREGGVLTRRELEQVGLPSSTISYRTRAGGPWQRPLPGIVVTHNGPLTRQERIRCALKYAGPGSCVTGMTALRERGLRAAANETEVHVLIPHGRHRLGTGFVVIERTMNMPETHVMANVPYAEVARAVIDACRRLRHVNAARAIISEAAQRGFATVNAIRSELRAAAARGSALPRRVLREVQAGVRSVAEAKAREQIHRSRLPKPAWNVTLLKGRTTLGTVDAYWAAYGLVLEIDSLEWHLSPDAYKRTQRRQRRLVAAGLTVVAIAPGDVVDDPVAFIATLRQAIAQSRGPADAITVEQSAA